jgi:hypothetical protein
MDDEIERAVEQRRRWLDTQLAISAAEFDLTVTGAVVNTFDLRSAGAAAIDASGTAVWLRVVVEDPSYQPACRWDGNVEANAIHHVPKPAVVRWADRAVEAEHLPGHRLRTEIMDLVPAAAISEDALLREDPQLPDQWWTDLDRALHALADHPAPPVDEIDTLGYLARGVKGLFDVELDVHHLESTIEWTTAHADLHWGNITGPQLYLLDWESWRRAPAGYDVATLYCNSLLVPEVAACVRERIGSVLEQPSGAVALLLAARRYLVLADDDAPYAPLLKPLRQLGEEQLAREPLASSTTRHT